MARYLIRTSASTLFEALGQRHPKQTYKRLFLPILILRSCVVLNDALPRLACGPMPQKRGRSSDKRMVGCPAPIGVHLGTAHELSEWTSVLIQMQPLRHDSVHPHCDRACLLADRQPGNALTAVHDCQSPARIAWIHCSGSQCGAMVFQKIPSGCNRRRNTAAATTTAGLCCAHWLARSSGTFGSLPRMWTARCW